MDRANNKWSSLYKWRVFMCKQHIVTHRPKTLNFQVKQEHLKAILCVVITMTLATYDKKKQQQSDMS